MHKQLIALQLQNGIYELNSNCYYTWVINEQNKLQRILSGNLFPKDKTVNVCAILEKKEHSWQVLCGKHLCTLPCFYINEFVTDWLKVD